MIEFFVGFIFGVITVALIYLVVTTIDNSMVDDDE
jgi:hypothetical protein